MQLTERIKRSLLCALLLANPISVSANIVDSGTRQFLRLPTAEGREIARVASDVLVTTLVATPLLLRAKDGDWRGFGTDASTLLATSGAVYIAKHLTQRERPYQVECLSNPQYSSDCGTDDSRRSFFSGHTASAFTGAALMCKNHPSLCAVSMGLAGTTGVLRIASDRHYLTDVLAGAGAGLLIGWFLPPWIEPVFQPSASSPEGAKMAARLHFRF